MNNGSCGQASRVPTLGIRGTLVDPKMNCDQVLDLPFTARSPLERATRSRLAVTLCNSVTRASKEEFALQTDL